MKEFVQPGISDEHVSLVCPTCRDVFLHQGKVEVFQRREDSESGIRAVIDNEKILSLSTTEQDGNPSGRRDGIRIWFSCEMCDYDREPMTYDSKRSLSVFQHKGTTYLEWGV